MRVGVIILIIGLAIGGGIGYFYGFNQGQTDGRAEAAAEFLTEENLEIPEHPIEGVGYENPFAEIDLNPFTE